MRGRAERRTHIALVYTIRTRRRDQVAFITQFNADIALRVAAYIGLARAGAATVVAVATDAVVTLFVALFYAVAAQVRADVGRARERTPAG